MTKQSQLDKLIQEAATKEVDGAGFRKRMERWMDLNSSPYIGWRLTWDNAQVLQPNILVRVENI